MCSAESWKRDEVDGVAGVLGADEVRECHGDALGWREAVFAVENHRVRAVEQHDRGAGGLVIGLLDLQVGVFEVQLAVVAIEVRAFAGEDVRECGGDVEVEGIAEFVGFGAAVGLDAGGFVARIVATERGFAERAEEFAEGLVAEEVHAFVGDFKAGVFAFAALTLTFGGLFGVDEALLLHLLDDLVDEVFNLLFVERFVFLLGLLVEEVA